MIESNLMFRVVSSQSPLFRLTRSLQLAHRTVFTTSPSTAQAVAIGITPSLSNTGQPDVTFHRRPLPTSLISFTSDLGKQMFRTALSEGHAEGYFNLAGNFTTQVEPAYCGPSSMAMALNALEVDPMKRWKGAWRWYNEDIILEDACLPREHVIQQGITYGQFSCIAKKHCHIISKRAHMITLEEFREDVRQTCQSSDSFIVVAFSRKVLGQTGDGHFSPLGAYNAAKDAVLVLDVARFKYPSYFVPIEELYRSMTAVDKLTGLPRGYFILKAHSKASTAAAPLKNVKSCSLNCIKIMNALRV